ncbi:MAG: NAD(P)H-dependent oxidoreductase [Pseudomonadota bacterium]
MHVLIVIDHPNKASFTHAVAARFADGVKDAGHQVEIADLHDEGFNPVWQMADFAQDAEDGTPMPPDVLAEQGRILRADAFALCFPLWWWGMPSVMKGWVDRVFSWGWAYDQLDDPTPQGSRLAVKPCVLLVPAGVSPDSMGKGGYTAALETLWIDGTFGYFGMDAALHVLHGATGRPERRLQHLELAYGLGQKIGN